MRFLNGVAAVATVVSTVTAVPQFFDGYEEVPTNRTELQMRSAYAGPGEVVVSWNTGDHITYPCVRYGLDKSLGHQAKRVCSDVSVTYPTSLTYNNHVHIKGLKDFTKYYWLPEESKASEPYTFYTTRHAGDHTPFTVALLVDMGTFGELGLSTTDPDSTDRPLRPGEHTTIQSLSDELSDYEFLWHPGDIAYADYWLKEEIQGYLPNTTIANGYKIYEHILNSFYDQMLNITSAKPYMVGAGNHEADCDNGGYKKYDSSICVPGQQNFSGYINHWRMPSPDNGVQNFWYSFDYGMAHMVQIDTETDLGNGLVGPSEVYPAGPFGYYQNAQIDWLKKDLASVDRKKTPWVIVSGHRPFYLSSDDSICTNCTIAFEDIFHEYGVDLYLCGHAHLYERMTPLYKNVSDPNGLDNPSSTWYITNGAAGHYDGLDSFNAWGLKPYSRFAENTDYSWSKLKFHNCTHMTVQTLASTNGTVFDEATLYKNRTCHGDRWSGHGWGNGGDHGGSG